MKTGSPAGTHCDWIGSVCWMRNAPALSTAPTTCFKHPSIKRRSTSRTGRRDLHLWQSSVLGRQEPIARTKTNGRRIWCSREDWRARLCVRWLLKGAEYAARERAFVAFVATNSVNQGAQVHQLWPRIFDLNRDCVSHTKTSGGQIMRQTMRRWSVQSWNGTAAAQSEETL